ncbi:MAG TPA: hypothetical protein VNO25_10955 [Streptosporangiaceae bacterium]|nr:hypothetical protein [Streptosporangiaceae bacterium]
MMIRKILATGGLGAVLVGGIAGAAAGAAYHPASAVRSVATVQHVKVTGPSQAKESDPSDPSGEATSPETDGPGGHQDPAGQNVDHQFDGVE